LRIVESTLVPETFQVPQTFEGAGFHLEPLGPEHNERDHRAWMSSIEHIRLTPGMGARTWPVPMTVEENMSDMQMHAREFVDRSSFTYSVLDGEQVIGCVYIYPTDEPGQDAEVRSWVTASRDEMDVVVWRDITRWLEDVWPFRSFAYSDRQVPSEP
jgi:hypothetical protein